MGSLRRALLACCVAAGASPSLAADVPGSKDPPNFKRYEGSQIVHYVSRSYVELKKI